MEYLQIKLNEKVSRQFPSVLWQLIESEVHPLLIKEIKQICDIKYGLCAVLN